MSESAQAPQVNETNESSTNKSLNQHKQAINIRKIAQDSLTPMMARYQFVKYRLEEHVRFLLQQTSRLKKQSTKAQQIISTQKHVQQEIKAINGKLLQTHSLIVKMDSQRETQIVTATQQLKQLVCDVDILRDQAVTRDQILHKVKQDTRVKTLHFDQEKTILLAQIQELKSKLQIYYQKQIKEIQRLKQSNLSIWSAFDHLAEARKIEQKQSQNVGKVIALYESQRDEIRSSVERAILLANTVVYTDKYEADKRAIKLQNSLLKESIKKLLNQALTPEIRLLLPLMIEKMNQLKTIDHRTNILQQKNIALQKYIQSLQLKHNNQQTQIKYQLLKFNNYFVPLSKFIEQYSQLRQQILFLKDALKQHEMQNENEFQKMVIWVRNQLEKQNQLFIQKHKEEIYSCVKAMQPALEKQQEIKIKQIVYSVQPLIEGVKESINQCRDDFSGSKQSLEQKLSLFANQITRIKSDVKIQMAEVRKSLQSHGNKLNESNGNCVDISKAVAKCVQTLLLLCSLQIQGKKEPQVFVTYHDGIILQTTTNETEIQYRKKIMNKSLLKRAILNEIIKMIDQIVINNPLMKWNTHKPSYFFNQIINNYLKINNKNSSKIIENSERNQSPDNQDYLKPRQKKNIKGERQSKGMSTIQGENNRYNKNQDNQTLPERKNIRLRKIQQKKSQMI